MAAVRRHFFKDDRRAKLTSDPKNVVFKGRREWRSRKVDSPHRAYGKTIPQPGKH